ncbi:MAG: hypothetical protein KME64_39725 [Scytonematopsis contorta HA4267-MV1]|jgi:hypothetical protein|nr:hypothetical protein [Scytonematopsis contorta HA4267-MV1]
MNRKFIGILAASAAFLGSAIFAAPAKATEQEVGVNITVQPTMFLRTFQTINLNITQGDLGGTDKDFNSTPVSDGTTLIDKTAPETLGSGNLRSVTKKVPEIFAVWGNTGTNATVNVTVAPGGDILRPVGSTGTGTTTRNVTMTALATNNTGPLNAETPLVGGADLTFAFGGTRVNAGRYEGGKLLVRAVANP